MLVYQRVNMMELASWFHTFRHFFSASNENHRATRKSTQPGSPIGPKTMIWTWHDRREGRETHFKLLKMPPDFSQFGQQNLWQWSRANVWSSFGVRMVPFASLIIGFVLLAGTIIYDIKHDIMIIDILWYIIISWQETRHFRKKTTTIGFSGNTDKPDIQQRSSA